MQAERNTKGTIDGAGVLSKWPLGLGCTSRMALVSALLAVPCAFGLALLMPDRNWLPAGVLGFGLAAAVSAGLLRHLEEHMVTLAKGLAGARDHAVEKAARLDRVLDNLPVGVFATDAAECLSYTNRTLGRWVDRSTDALTAEPTSLSALCETDMLPPEHGVATIYLRSATGGRLPAYMMRSAVVDGLGTHGVILRDPSEPTMTSQANGKVSQTALMRSDGMPPAWLFDDSPVGIAILDADRRIEHCNGAFERFFDQIHDGLVGRDLVDHVCPEDRDGLRNVLSGQMLRTVCTVHTRVRLPESESGTDGRDGRVSRAMSIFAARTGNKSGGASRDRVVVHAVDETEHRHLEIQFAQSQKMQAVGQLAGGIAHDFNNLLTAMIGFCDLLLQRHGPEDPSFADIMQVRQNANRATGLVRQLLAFSRKQALAPVIIDPAEALADLSHLLGRLLGEAVRLDLRSGPDVWLIRADRSQFDQVIINLAVNARDAMQNGGVLGISLANEIITEPLRHGDQAMPPGSYVVIAVADTGSGMPTANLEHIFEPFFSTKEAGTGTGLGLSTVYGIVRQSEGFIFVESTVGQGTTFRIYLPACDGEESEQNAPLGQPATDGADVEDGATDLTGTGLVLLVEDEDAVRQFAARTLRNKGYAVLEARNGETALEAIRGTRQPVDLIVSDAAMPGMNGHTLVQTIRRQTPDVKVILTSGYAEDAFRDEISHNPSIHFLTKPFSLEMLAQTVKRVIERNGLTSPRHSHSSSLPRRP